MVKYGKEFRKNQNLEWIEKYFDYKAKKKMIKEYASKKEGYDINTADYILELEKWINVFEKSIDQDIKKVYIFFSNQEKVLYKQINESLHLKEDYENLDLNGYLEEVKALKEISELSVKMSNFVFYNLKAVIKILKKFDKKIVTQKNKYYFIKFNYIQTKIEEQNSDILYLIKFKMVDEVNILLENLITKLMKEFKSNKEYLNDDTNDKNEGENKLIEEVPEMNQAIKIIKEYHEQILKNIQETDKVSARIQNLFFTWKDFLKISNEMGSKLMQITRENTLKDSFSERTMSIVQSISFSKDSKNNLYIILAHGFLYMFSFSVIIPSYTLIIGYFSTEMERQVSYALLMMMAPFGTLFNYLYETFLFKKSTKKPLLISCIGLIIGNLLYMIAPETNAIALLFIGRFICGLFNLRTHNKMYIINFLSQKDISFYLTMFHTFSILGLGVGFLINSGLLYIDIDSSFFNKCTIGSMISIIFSIILLIFTFFKFTEVHSNKFNMTSMQMFGEGIINNDEEFCNDEEAATFVRRQSMALKDIDLRLGSFNEESKFDDTNLVAKSISELTTREEGKLHYLLNGFIVYFLIIFTTKFINESIFINSNIFLSEEKENENWIIPVILGCSSMFILVVELSLSRKYKFITERNLIIILLFLLLIVNLLFIVFNTVKKAFYFLIALDNIVASITEKYVAHMFLYIMPENYIICRINGNVFISIFSMISRILCCFLLLIFQYDNFNVYNYTMFSIMTFLCFLCFLLYIIFYKELRIKAINRILKSKRNDEIKIPTEV